MKRFASQYIITNSGPPLKRGVITTDDGGTIISIEDTEGDLKEKHSTEFHNGIIIPGFVNCHCHLELSHMKDYTLKGKGLGGFIEYVRGNREFNKEGISAAIFSADKFMYKEGVNLCADVCNTSDSFNIKRESRIKYINLLEVFGLDPEKAGKRFNEITKVAQIAREMDLQYSLVPHSAYSLSTTLFRLLRNESLNNKITSIHFMESAGENIFLLDHTGPLMSSYKRSGLLPPRLETASSHADVVLNEITRSGNLILIHNTFAERNIIRMVKKRERLFWCLCPNSNVYIENRIPPLDLLLEEDCQLVIGTDSLASNSNLSILDELKTLQFEFSDLSIEDLVSWATINGARALCEEQQFGTIETGKKPGLLLLKNVDLINMKLLPDSFVTRLI
jgi:cytosine/adenosine deaminase-related metal-dependent hydrolase